MKKIILSLAIASITFSVYAQKEADLSFDENTSYLHLGVGFGGGFYSGTISLPPISIGYEKAVTEKFSVGGIVGYSSSKYGSGTDYLKYTYILFGARGNYHFATTDKFDPYGGITLGYNAVSVSVPSSGGNNTAKGSSILAGGQLGANYYLSSNTGVFAELGFGIGIFTIGFSKKF